MDFMKFFGGRDARRAERQAAERNAPKKLAAPAPVVAAMPTLGRIRESRPGPWLKHAPEKAPIHLARPMGVFRLLDSGTVYEPRRDGWRRRRDVELEMAKGAAA